MRPSPSRFLLLTIAYAATGWLALRLAVPPGYAVPVFPPAGIALSALLIFGLRMWPAICLGSLLIQVAGTTGSPPALPGLLSGLVVAAGVSLQAVAGASFARRLIGYPDPLDSPSAIMRFVGLVAPLSSLIAPCIAIPALHAAGRLPASELGFNWWNWWVGDTLGVVLTAPLMLVFFGQPAEHWRPRRVGVAVPLGLAMLVLATGFRQMLAWEDARVHAEFDRDANHFAAQFSKRLAVQLDIMLALERLVLASEFVTPEEFRTFVQPWLVRYPDALNFSWNPLVSAGERAAFETRVRRGGMPAFGIRDRSETGHLLRAGEAAEYLPMLYVEPAVGNSSVLGLNPLSVPEAARAIERTRRSGTPIATEGFRLSQENSGRIGIVVYLAVFRPAAGGTGSPRLQGLVAGALRMDDVLAGLMRRADRAGIQICLIEHDAATGAGGRLAGERECDRPRWLEGPVVRSVPIEFAGRQWSLNLKATDAYLSATRSWGAWVTVAVAPLAVGLLGAFLLVTTGQARRIAALVDQRTRELAEAQRLGRIGSWEMAIAEGAGGGGPGGNAPLRRSAELDSLLELPPARACSLEDLVKLLIPADRPALVAALEEARQKPSRTSLDCHLATLPARVLNFCIESEWEADRLLRLRGTVQDVTAAREAEAHIKYLARHDTLTGLPNRTTWLEAARTALRAAQRHDDTMAVLFIDLDNFKTVNDRYGHGAGDSLLAAIAQRLSACMREEDVLARLGGDEFVALLPRVERGQDAAAVAQKMLSTLGEPVTVDGHEVLPTVSIGIALYPFDGSGIQQLLRHADAAMYVAKQAGRNTWRFFGRDDRPPAPAMRKAATARQGDDGLADNELSA
jgi:diguanylate cyclase (GGDEF)-like protein